MAWRRRGLWGALLSALVGVGVLAGAHANVAGVDARDRDATAALRGGPSHARVSSMGSDAPVANAHAEHERLAREQALYTSLVDKTARTELETNLMRALEQSSRYPADNQRFPTAAHDPVLRERAVERREKRSPDGRYLLSVWTDRKQYDLDAAMTVHASLLDAQQQNVATFAGLPQVLLYAADGKVLASVGMRRERAGEFSASLQSGRTPLPEGLYTGRVSVSAQFSQSFAFVVRPAYAQLTGGHRDHLEGGHLLIDVQVDALEEGDYYLFGSLYSDDGIPIGTAELTQHLTAGENWLPLRFFGRLLHDGGHDGPFRLAHVSLAKRTFPISQGVDGDPDYWTAPYALSELDPEPYRRLDAD